MVLPQISQAVYAVEKVVTDPVSGLGITSVGSMAGFAINIILGAGWALTFIMLAAGFIKFITSKGETKATDSAKQWLTAAAAGGVGMFFLTVIKSIVMNLLGADTTPGGGDEFDPFGDSGGGPSDGTPCGSSTCTKGQECCWGSNGQHYCSSSGCY
ncbi:MAG: hypothetical protein ACD_22C00100G0006 [uncultured bacterium]|nr:MAG: hypothetical protein ACD_22C00100G0006 [uncultured bacterium]